MVEVVIGGNGGGIRVRVWLDLQGRMEMMAMEEMVAMKMVVMAIEVAMVEVELYTPPSVISGQNHEEPFEHKKMLPPPTRYFQTREAFLEHVRGFGKTQGYIVTIKKLRRDHSLILGCDRGGSYRKCLKVSDSQRETSTCLIRCPFRMEGRRMPDGSWRLKVNDGEHNHEPLEDISCHPYSRRFSEEEILQIKEMANTGIQPRQMLIALRNGNPDHLAISRDVYNLKAKIRKKKLSGRTPIQALLDELVELVCGGFQHSFKYDEEGHLTHLFFSHPNSIALSKSYSNVFIMDCTYKTNKYKMPLFDVVGVTSFNTSFYSCFAFLQNEEVEDYRWALEKFNVMLGDDSQPVVIITDRELALMKAIQVIFPRAANLLCLWHIEKNVLSKCKSFFDDGNDWKVFLYA
ncbi:protein FAR1-RELATED SEQUENCE 5-like [Tasmannia lanceolata]|uniref:protein FAR1-RELATED SEQUENCE 5-like n=1 Tax=Tasmannia lanceolata TaxID=3420 RepID=UPI00406430C7